MVTTKQCLVILCFLLLIISGYETYRRGSKIDLVDRINENHRLLRNDNPSPVAPTVLTRQPQPVAPPMDVGVAPPTDAPVAPPPSPPVSEPVAAATEPSTAPVVVVDNNNPPTASQSMAPIAPSPTRQQSSLNDYIVPLLSFTVSTDESDISKLTRTLEDYLYAEMKNDLPDLLSIQLQNVSLRRRRSLLMAPPSSLSSLSSVSTSPIRSSNNNNNNNSHQRTLLDSVSFSGAAIFATLPVPNALQVYSSQERVLTQDLSDEGISSLQLQTAPTTNGGAGGTKNKSITVPLIAGVAAAAAVMLIVAAIVAYRYFTSPAVPSASSMLPLDKMKNNNKKKNHYHDESSYETRESPAGGGAPISEIRSNMSVAQSDFDDYSLDGYSYVAASNLDSATSSVTGHTKEGTGTTTVNPTQLYLANRMQQKQQQQQQQNMMPNRSSFDDQSESEFSYGFVGNGNDVQADSDDDMFTSDGIEVSMEDDGNNGTSFAREGSPMFTGIRQNVAVEKFDEESPFDEVKPKKATTTTTTTSTKTITKVEDEARILANQLMYEREHVPELDLNAQLALSGSAGGDEDEGGDLTEFLRERRRAKRASRKQPPLSMEI